MGFRIAEVSPLDVLKEQFISRWKTIIAANFSLDSTLINNGKHFFEHVSVQKRDLPTHRFVADGSPEVGHYEVTSVDITKALNETTGPMRKKDSLEQLMFAIGTALINDPSVVNEEELKKALVSSGMSLWIERRGLAAQLTRGSNVGKRLDDFVNNLWRPLTDTVRTNKINNPNALIKYIVSLACGSLITTAALYGSNPVPLAQALSAGILASSATVITPPLWKDMSDYIFGTHPPTEFSHSRGEQWLVSVAKPINP